MIQTESNHRADQRAPFGRTIDRTAGRGGRREIDPGRAGRTPRAGWTRALLLVGGLSMATALVAAPIRPLAQEHVVVAKSPDPKSIYLFTPTILRLPSGRLLAAYERGGPGHDKDGRNARVLSSDDGGKTWTERGHMSMTHGRLFTAGKSIYYLGHHGDLQVSRSDDNGESWSEPAKLTTGQTWHQSACNVWHKGGRVYLVMERRVAHDIKAWPVGELAPVLMRGSEDADLTRRENWTFASELVFADVVPGYRQNHPQLGLFGLPFLASAYPNGQRVPGGQRVAPMGWLETNVVQVLDPKHYWYDPAGKTFHLLMRAHTGGTGYAALAKVVEHEDGRMTTELESAPSGQKMLLLPLPGGQMRFHILYDPQTKLYWLLSSQATDSMTRSDELPPDRYHLPNNERHRLVLHFSRNLVDWCFAGVVAIGDTAGQARHYASMDFDGDDLVILSRSGDAEAKDAHNGDLITFHRVVKFRELVY